MELTEEQIIESAEKATENRYQEKMEDMHAFSSTLEAANGYNDGYHEGAKWMQEQQPKWISVEDRLPEITGWYLVAYPAVQVSFFFVEPDHLGRTKEFIDKGVTHWMPLPEPPTSSTT